MNSQAVFLTRDSDVGSLMGKGLVVHLWSGSGPDFLHVHHSDDEIWHVVEGTLGFKIGRETLRAEAGTTVLVPAGTPHTYWEEEPSRYLLVLSHNLDSLISELHASGGQNTSEILAKHDSELVDT